MTATPEKPVDQGRQGRAKRYADLEEAFRDQVTPVANQAVIRRIVEGSDVTGFVGFRTYFRIERRGSAALEVHDAYTNGFRSEADAARLGGDLERWPSRRFHGAWGITHPETRSSRIVVNKPPRARKATSAGTAPRRASAAPEKPEAVCPTCFMVLPATGVCATCDA